jgi:hypothetical protein
MRELRLEIRMYSHVLDLRIDSILTYDIAILDKQRNRQTDQCFLVDN